MAARASKKQKALKDKDVVVADLRGRLRVERRWSRAAQINLEKSDKAIEALRRESDDMAEETSSLPRSDVVVSKYYCTSYDHAGTSLLCTIWK